MPIEWLTAKIYRGQPTAKWTNGFHHRAKWTWVHHRGTGVKDKVAPVQSIDDIPAQGL